VLDRELHVELWNDVAEDLWGLRAEEVRGKHFFGLDIGLPIEHLKQPIAALTRQSDQPPFEVEVQALNRRGRQVRLRVRGGTTPATNQTGSGVIILMQQVDPVQPAQVTH
jgi:two-component system CheB/CheR fusion protein